MNSFCRPLLFSSMNAGAMLWNNSRSLTVGVKVVSFFLCLKWISFDLLFWSKRNALALLMKWNNWVSECVRVVCIVQQLYRFWTFRSTIFEVILIVFCYDTRPFSYRIPIPMLIVQSFFSGFSFGSENRHRQQKKKEKTVNFLIFHARIKWNQREAVNANTSNEMKRNQIKLKSNYRNEFFNCPNNQDNRKQESASNYVIVWRNDEVMCKMSILLLKIHNHNL